MPRYARKKSETHMFHIMLRGINKQSIFEDDEDRHRFLETLKHYKTISKYEIYSYCLMNNHVHFLMKETAEPISTVIKRISSSYVYWYNWKYERCGHLFQERFKSETVENEEYFLTILRYIHQNPVKAGLSINAADYKWSSYSEYIKKAAITNIDFALELFSVNKEKAIDLFETYSNMQNEDECLEYKEKYRVPDSEVQANFGKLGFSNLSELQQMEKARRNEIVKLLKSIDGVTIRQLSRLTGISKSVIDRLGQ